jgi:hypothetical protein
MVHTTDLLVNFLRRNLNLGFDLGKLVGIILH